MGNVEVAYCRFRKSCHRTVFQVHPSCCFTVSFIKCFVRDICLIRSYDSVNLITSKFLANVKFLREKDGFI